MKAALKKMQDDVKNVNDSLLRVSAYAKDLLRVADIFVKAAADTQLVESAKAHLESLREATRDDSSAARVAATIKKRNLKIPDIVYGWDPDGKGVGADACAYRSAISALPPPHLCALTR
jgi:hypothetical protein